MSDIVNVPMTAQRDIRTVTAEIRSLHRQAQCMVLGYAIEIGRKLKEAKTLLPYGQWGQWLREEVEFSQSTAQNFMKIFEEYGARQVSLFGDAESQTLGNLPYTHALKLLALPAEEREEFAREHHVEDLSSRELADLLRERDQAREDATRERQALTGERDAALDKAQAAEKARREAETLAQAARAQLETAKKAAEESRKALRELRENPEVPETVLAKLRAEADQAAQQAAEKQLQAAQEAEKRAEGLKKALEYKTDESRRRVEQLEKQLAAADPDTAVFKTWFAAIQQDFLRLREAESQVSGREAEKGQKLRNAVRALLRQQEEIWA